MNNLIKHKLELLPNNPGCYLHKDKFGNIIYVGKAKNLKNRVRSYFRGSHDTKTELLVSEIADFEFIVTESNIEALLLEINLIQENMPNSTSASRMTSLIHLSRLLRSSIQGS